MRDWEQGRRVPDAPARALLTALSRDPNAVAHLLAADDWVLTLEDLLA